MDTNTLIEERKVVETKLGQVRFALDASNRLVGHLEKQLATAEQELAEVNTKLQASLIR